MNMSVLVLGAQGFVGRRLVAHLAAHGGFDVTAAGRRPQPGTAAWRVQQLDATDAQSIRAALHGIDAVVNCVSGSPEAIRRNADALAGALAAHVPAPRLVHFSSMAAYGAVVGRVDEQHPLRADAGPYGQAKAYAETTLAAVGGIMVRPGCIYGRGSPQWSVRIAQLVQARRLGDLGPAGDAPSNLVHVDDVCQATVAALGGQAPAGAYNLAMRDAPRWNDYFIRYARTLGAVPVRRIPAWQLKLERKLLGPALKVCEIAGRRIGVRVGSPVLSPSMLDLFRQHVVLVPDKAEAQFQLRWRTLEAALAEPEAQP